METKIQKVLNNINKILDTIQPVFLLSSEVYTTHRVFHAHHHPDVESSTGYFADGQICRIYFVAILVTPIDSRQLKLHLFKFLLVNFNILQLKRESSCFHSNGTRRSINSGSLAAKQFFEGVSKSGILDAVEEEVDA